MRNAHQGSITIFSLLSMLLVAATLLSFLEGARYWEIKRLSSLQTELSMESVFANYSTALWEEYHLLGCPQILMQKELLEHANGKYSNEEDAMNLMVFQADGVEITSYTLLTDGNGEAYIDTVSSYMEKTLLYETAKEIYSRYEAVKAMKENSKLDLSDIEEAIEQIEEASDSSTQSGGVLHTRDAQNLLEVIQDLLGKGVLELVLEDSGNVTGNVLDGKDLVSRRTLEKGKHPKYEQSGWWEKILLQQYVLTYMSNYCDTKEGHFINYEVEYLITGEVNEQKSLQQVLSELLLIREVANFLYLSKDIQKVATAEAVALALVGISANPALIASVKFALLAAWAFAESVLDVRALLVGKHIPLIKSDDSWTLDLEDIGSIADGYATSKSSQWGLSYKDYLGILLLFQEETVIAMRAMDVQEATMRQGNKDLSFRMDEVVVNMEAEIIYGYHPVFLIFQERLDVEEFSYKVKTNASYGYQ